MDVTHIVIPIVILVLFVVSMLLTELVGRRWAKGFGIVCLVGVFGLIVAEIALIAA